MDYYKVLGIDRNATEDEVKRAYRKLASKHHPDKGGDTAKFQEIQVAYDAITSGKDNKQSAPDFNPFGSNFQDLHEMFNMGRRAGARNWTFNTGWDNDVKNPDVNISIPCSLKEAHMGFTKTVEFTLPDKTLKNLSVTFPPGCNSDVKIRYNGEGGSLVPHLPPGDLYVKLDIAKDMAWTLMRNDLFIDVSISVWQAMLGTTIKLVDIADTEIEVSIPPGTQHGTQLRLRNRGFNIRGLGSRGNGYVNVKVKIPALNDEDQLKTIVDLQSEK
jgi:curved DNA-binding protein